MIYYVSTERFSSTVRGFLKGDRSRRRYISSLTYEELFFERRGPIGHYIFTDFDRLSRYELECAAAFSLALRAAAPQARILNDPLAAKERLPLLQALEAAGINDFGAVRLEGGERPRRYPVFIRAEDGYSTIDTDILPDEAAFEAALADLRRRGLPLRGRIAVGYAAERSPDGYFRKYAAFNIGGRIIPSHIMRGQTWVVKVNIEERAFARPIDRQARLDEEPVAEEFAFVRDNPHREVLERAFAIAGIEFGRTDYGLVGGKVQIYEINTNPSLPGALRQDARGARRAILHEGFRSALSVLDTPLAASGRISFPMRRPRPHNTHLPRRRLPASLSRRLTDLIAGRGRGTSRTSR